MPINYKDYHPKWKKISFFIRHYRAKWKCEWCEAENGFLHPITGSKVVLTVAHIDHDKNNNSFFNLAALCQKCHLGHDLKRHLWNRKYRSLENAGQMRLEIFRRNYNTCKTAKLKKGLQVRVKFSDLLGKVKI